MDVASSGQILKAESKGFANGLTMWYERKRVKDDPKSFDLSKWIIGIVINEDGDACKGSGFVGEFNENLKFGLDLLTFRCLLAVHAEKSSRHLDIGVWH